MKMLEGKKSAPAKVESGDEERLTRETLDAVADHCGIEGSLSIIGRPKEGATRSTHILGSENDRFLLKRFVDSERARAVHRIENLMCSNGIPAVAALGPSGEEQITVHGSVWSLYPFVDGKHMQPGELTTEALHSSGAMLARIHGVNLGHGFPEGAVMKMPFNPSVSKRKMESVLALIAGKKERDSFDDEAEASLRMKLALVEEYDQPVDFSAYPLAAVHGDYQPGNILFDDNDRVSWVIDWEHVYLAPRITEAVRAALFLSLVSQYDDASAAHAAAFLSAYYAKQPFSKDELSRGLHNLIRSTVLGTWIVDCHYAGNQYADRFLEKEMKNIPFMVSHKEEVINHLWDTITKDAAR